MLAPSGRDVIWPTGEAVEFDSTPVICPCGNLRLWFAGGASIRAPVRGEDTLFHLQGKASSPVPLAADASRGDFQVQLQAGGVETLQLARGDFFYVEDAI